MRPLGLIRYATRALTERKLRAVLTILGIVIGPATIVSLVSATQGYSNASTAQFSSLGATTLFVAPVGRGTTLTSADVATIQAFSGVSSVLPYQQISGQVSDGGYSIFAQVVAIDFSQLPSAFPTLALGQGTTPADTDTVGAAIGYSIANPGLQGAGNFTVNQVMTVSGLGRAATFTFNGNNVGFGSNSQSAATKRSFVVRGVYNQFGQGFGVSPDDTIFIPLASGEVILHSATYTGIMVVASSPSTVTNVTNELTAQYGSNIRITSVSSLLSSIQSVTSGATTLLEAVGGTSVLVAFIGIMTTMLTSVLERTKEIGVLKALGSSSRDIMLIFLAEAVVTGLLGGVIGVGSGYALSFLVIGALSGTLRVPSFGGGAPVVRAVGAAATAARGAAGGAVNGGFNGPAASAASSSTLAITPSITPEIMVLAILLAIAVGTFGGLIPAWRASRLNPVEALRRS
ncbi:MAG: ABC transporter permease [Thaumarchaeota archaeon]|nr:ABC transporter permease [Nitrososphaerota archaeon]